jgi:hypothetical protein
MKQYPEISNTSKSPHKPCYAFIKYDGSNLRFEWSKKQGWNKFGTRKLMINESHPKFGSAIPLFKQKYGNDLERIFKKDKIFRSVDQVIVFCEWFGVKSFAGQHKSHDPKTLVLFDVNPIKKGILGPREFIDTFGHLEVAELVYQGNLNESLIQAVRLEDFDFIDFRSRYSIATEIPEGIVCKGGTGHDLWMCKIKTQNYYNELQNRFPCNWDKFWE